MTVALIVVAALAVAAVPVVLLVRRARRVKAELAQELMAEPALRGPEPAIYRSGSGPYPRVKGNGLIVLTARRLSFRIVVGRSVDIPLAEITGLREDKWFQRARVGGRTHLIVQTAAGEAGFFVSDNAAWIAAIEAARAGPAGSR
jgi:hypothetical protein